MTTQEENGTFGILIKNNKNLTEEDIKLELSRFGEVVNTRMIRNNNLVFVHFGEQEEANACLEELRNDPDFSARPAIPKHDKKHDSSNRNRDQSKKKKKGGGSDEDKEYKKQSNENAFKDPKSRGCCLIHVDDVRVLEKIKKFGEKSMYCLYVIGFPLDFMMCDAWDLCSEYAKVIHLNYQYSRNPKESPFAEVFVSSEEDQQNLKRHLKNLRISGKPIAALTQSELVQANTDGINGSKLN